MKDSERIRQIFMEKKVKGFCKKIAFFGWLLIMAILLLCTLGCPQSQKAKSTSETSIETEGDVVTKTETNTEQDQAQGKAEGEKVQQQNNDPWVGRIAVCGGLLIVVVVILGFWFGGLGTFGRR
jgi:hypothetical protein